MKRLSRRPRTIALLAAGLVIFPIANCVLYGARWANGGIDMFFVVMLEAALAVALGVQVERSLVAGKRK